MDPYTMQIQNVTRTKYKEFFKNFSLTEYFKV